MADALCGPSNPLQSFQKHTQADHTLQQDRIRGLQHSPAQGFRTRDPRTGSLDADFAAFEAGPPNPFQLDQPFLHRGLPTHQTPISRQNGAAPGWAADFQNLHIGNQPVPSHQFRAEAPLVRSTGWQNEFAARQSNGRSSVAQGKQSVQPPSQNQLVSTPWRSGQYGVNDGYMGIAGMPYGYNEQQQLEEQNQYQQQAQPVYDEAGFADAFDQASQHVQEMAKEGTDVDRTMERDGSDLLHKDAIPSDPSHIDHDLSSLIKPPSPSQIRIGSDAIPYREHKIRAPDQDSRDADELARTAAQLLTSVQHETSNKFQNSQFLALMRKIRDGEVRVQGEEFKEINPYRAREHTDAHQLHPGGRLYPGQSPQLTRATMSGGLPTYSGITADDLHHFDQLDESPGLSNRYQRPSLDDYNGGGGSGPIMERGMDKWFERTVIEVKARDMHVDNEVSKKNLIQARDCFVWKGMEEDGVT